MAELIKALNIGGNEYNFNATRLNGYDSGFIYKYGYAYPYGLSNKPWHKVASFTQDVKSTQINTGISFYVGEFYYSRTYGILNIQIRNEQGNVNPSFCHVVWSVNCGIACNEFVVGHSYSGTKVTYNLYVNRSGWSSYSLKKISEQAWGGEHNNWACYPATNGNEYCYATIPETNKYESTNLTLSNPPASHSHSYLPLSGGTLTSSSNIPLILTSSVDYSTIRFNTKSHQRTLGIKQDGELFVTNDNGWNQEHIIYHSGNLTKKIITDLGIPGTDTNTWPSNYVTTDTTQSVTASKNFNTSTNANPLCISRTGGNEVEVVKIGVDDSRVYFNYTNDETSCGFKFNMKNTDSESGGGAGANESYVLMYGSSNGSTVEANGFYKHDGTSVSYAGHTHDDRYYTETQIDTKLAGKSDTGHGHDYLPLSGGTLQKNSASILTINNTNNSTSSGSQYSGVRFAWNGSTVSGIHGRNESESLWRSNASFSNAFEIFDTGNYTTWVPKKDGTGASGDWSINITGSSGSCTGNAATATDSSKLGGVLAANYRRLDIHQMFGTEVQSQYYIDRCKDGGGGWAYAPICIYKSDKSTRLANIGVYGGGNTLTYAYFGAGNWNENNLRVDTSANVTANTFKKFDGTEVSYSGHTHDDRYYTETQIDTKLAGKSDTGHGHDYLPLSGGTMSLGEGLKFHSDDNYFGTNYDARIISILDGNGTTCDGGLIIDERCTYNGTEHITELLRIRDNEFKWKGTSISLDGHTHTKSQITDFPSSLPANGGNADTVGNYNIYSLMRHSYISQLKDKDMNYASNHCGTWATGDDAAHKNTPTNKYGAYISFGNFVTSDTISTRNQTAQIGVDCWSELGRTYVRARQAGNRDVSSFSDWQKLAFVSDIPTDYAASGHTHNYLPLSGGTLTNSLTLSAGNITVSAGSVSAKNGFFETSDEKLKDIQAPLTTDLEKLSHLRKVYFNFKEDPSKTHIGVIAQDIKELYPEIVNETDEGTLNVDYSKLSVIALDAVDQLNESNKELTKKYNELEEKLNSIIKYLNL